jgi:eukaryotic-like serine/threonine-protein kinase
MVDYQQGANGSSGSSGGDETARITPATPTQLAPGSILQNRYRIERVLGKGGMSNVYLVRDLHFEGVIALRALKEMIPRADVPNHLNNMTREVQLLMGLDHKRIPTVYDYFVDRSCAFMVMQYIEGRDLEALLHNTPGMLPPEVVTDWMIQLCDIVYFLHTQETPIIFRDLKPSNLILTERGQIYLIDFGIAKEFKLKERQTTVGTQGYAAPEQYRGAAEIRSDIFGLGAMMHHLLTKTDPRIEPPFSFQKRPVRAYNAAVPPALEGVVMRCLEQEPDARYQSVHDLRHALEEAMGLGATINTGHFKAVRGSMLLGRTPSWGEGPAVSAIINRSTRVIWRFVTEEEVRSTPLVANDTVYVGSYDNNLYALDPPTGTLKWKFASEGGICCKPAPYRNLVIYGSEDFNVYGLDAASGKEAWRYRTWHHVRSSPRIYENRCYIGSDDGHMHAIEPSSGRMIWRHRCYREVQSSAVYANGVVYFGAGDEYFYAVDALTGERKWSYKTQGAVISSPTVADGYVYFGSMDFSVYALETKSGWLAWREPTERFVMSSPLIAGDKLYVGSTDKHLYCLERRTGHMLWKYPAGQQVTSSPVCDTEAVYFGCIDGAIYSIDAVTGKLRWRYQTGDMVPGSPVVHEGVVYIGSSDGNVYALDATP